MVANLMIGIKPETDPVRLLELATELSPPPGTIHLASFVSVGTSDNEPARFADAERHLETIAGRLRNQGYETAIHVQVNVLSAGSALVRLVEDHDIDLLVIGIVKRSRVGKALMGSDAQTAILTASCPVVSHRVG